MTGKNVQAVQAEHEAFMAREPAYEF